MRVAPPRDDSLIPLRNFSCRIDLEPQSCYCDLGVACASAELLISPQMQPPASPHWLPSRREPRAYLRPATSTTAQRTEQQPSPRPLPYNLMLTGNASNYYEAAKHVAGVALSATAV